MNVKCIVTAICFFFPLCSDFMCSHIYKTKENASTCFNFVLQHNTSTGNYYKQQSTGKLT